MRSRVPVAVGLRADVQGGDVAARPHGAQRPGGQGLWWRERVGGAARDGGGVAGGEQPRAGPYDGAVGDEGDDFEEFDGAARETSISSAVSPLLHSTM